ncbi:hypothetical protein B0T14DRAFT_135409 [Immersiella caudata]|uniref:Uncharacterized protein n=1 Tax=Immersiella caudata TaxID=314043 RepID=A0AA39X589_9PEZI|nr:hypothetical protein B0T14DRAFT_135409 [Immersiella caudata]
MSINSFSSPTRSDKWVPGQSQVVAWITDFPSYNIRLWQEHPTKASAEFGGVVFGATPSLPTSTKPIADLAKTVHSAGDPQVANITWKVQTYDLDPEFSNTYFFWLFNGTDTADKTVNAEPVAEFASPYFSIIPEARPRPTTTARSTTSTVGTASSSSATSTASSTTAGTASATSTPTSPPENIASGGGSASNAVPIGLGAGLGVAALLLILGAALWFLKRRREKAGLGRSVAEMPATAIHQPSPAMVGKPWDHGFQNQPYYEKRVELAQSSYDRTPNELE